MLKKIYLYGSIAKEFGSEWDLAVESPIEAVQAINANTGGRFLNFIRDMYLQVVRGNDLSGEPIDSSMVKINYKKGDFHFCPVAEGSGPLVIGGLILGAILTAGIVAYSVMNTVSPEDSMEDDVKGYEFSGSIGTDRQGVPVPLAYGEVYIGPIDVSQGIKAEEVV